jgi:hypothetical protein
MTRATGLGTVVLAFILALLPIAGPAWGQSRPDLSRIHILAVAPFADEAPLSGPLAGWGAARLSSLAARGPFQIIPASRVAEAMKRLGIVPSDLISPTRTVAIGQETGADAVLTGRITLLSEESHGRPFPFPARPIDRVDTRVDMDIRVLEVATRLILFQDGFICDVPSVSTVAMDCVLRDVVDRLGLNRTR